MYGEKNKNN